MNTGNSDRLLDEALAAVLEMRAGEIAEFAGRLEALAAAANDGPLPKLSQLQLNQLRAAVLQAAQLWHTCLPEADSNYSSDGLPASAIPAAGISISV